MGDGSTRLSAGVAGAAITPDRLLDLQGYDRGPATGTLDRLEARAIVFDDGQRRAAIVTADLIGLDRPSIRRIREGAAGAVPSGDVLVACSHTHSGPAVQGLGRSVVDATYLAWLEQTLADLVLAASRRLRPVRLGAGEGQMDFNVNRRRRTPQGTVMRANPLGTVDRRVRVLRVDAADAPEAPGTLGGRPLPQRDPLAVLFTYVCHATVLSDREHRPYSGDYPAAARRVVERAYAASDRDGPAGHSGDRSDLGGAGTSALFLPGCFGNVRPHLLGPDGAFRGGTPHELEVLGRLLGTEVVQVAERSVGEAVPGIAVARREVRLAYAGVPGEAELRAALDDGPAGRRRWAQALLDHLEREGRLPEAETAEVAVLRLGRHWLAMTPGETMLELGLSIERGLVELGLAQPERGDLTLALGYSNGNAGYLCTASSMPEGGYEPATAHFGYLRPASFGPEIEPVLVGTALALAQKIGPAVG